MTKPFGSIFLDDKFFDKSYEEKTKEYLIYLMKSSKTEKEWCKNFKIVLDEYSGILPNWWLKEIIESGFKKRVWDKFSRYRTYLADIERTKMLMESSKTELEWRKNILLTLNEYDGCLPSWWYQEIYDSGLQKRVWNKFE